ncbi:hypothetical protein [Roseibacillus ishigakijimensis]|nr:hypothetical protein [Roseibacillus ishigakijimensis]
MILGIALLTAGLNSTYHNRGREATYRKVVDPILDTYLLNPTSSKLPEKERISLHLKIIEARTHATPTHPSWLIRTLLLTGLILIIIGGPLNKTESPS